MYQGHWMTIDQIKAIKKRKVEEQNEKMDVNKMKKEELEAGIIRSYMPDPLSEAELSEAVETIVRETGARSRQQMGLVMKEVMNRYRGRVDGKTVQGLVLKKLG